MGVLWPRPNYTREEVYFGPSPNYTPLGLNILLSCQWCREMHEYIFRGMIIGAIEWYAVRFTESGALIKTAVKSWRSAPVQAPSIDEARQRKDKHRCGLKESAKGRKGCSCSSALFRDWARRRDL